MSIRLVSSISGVITNSSTEIFIIQGPDALKQMIGTGVYKKYKKDFVYLKTDEEIMEFILRTGRINHNYYPEMLRTILGKTYNTFFNCLDIFPEEDKDKIIEMFKPLFIKELKNTIIYYDYKHNQRILSKLKTLYPDDKVKKDNYRYYWNLD